MKDLFLEGKKKQLLRDDRSSIGSWDSKISGLCNKINKKKNYYTTSSCAGRVVLLKYSEVKQEDAFLFRTHNKISFNELKRALEKAILVYPGMIEFQQSCCILHIACLTLNDAQIILTKAKEAGWQRSGIIGGKRNMVELHSTESISFPIASNGKVLVDDNFLKLIVLESNNKLERVWKKIGRLKDLI
ncbi:tRNA(Phe) 7-((3-amino-3-carboxypropyl)-4-demethyl wyosine(37)-N(4))-methyltransferase [uncultured archaeon]|nr:tRNA(Phe) 7-((3-amino-3-carboxypropyl)-4-demethyl wyosine(37)-N(4))-methyltransferase [uncultured archaeon]